MTWHTGVLGVTHVIVGDVDIRVADPTILEVEADIVIADDIPLNVNLAELGVGGRLGPGHGGVHVAHDVKEIVIKTL